LWAIHVICQSQFHAFFSSSSSLHSLCFDDQMFDIHTRGLHQIIYLSLIQGENFRLICLRSDCICTSSLWSVALEHSRVLFGITVLIAMILRSWSMSWYSPCILLVVGGGPVVKAWDQEVCSLCGLRFEPCDCSYNDHWRLTWSLTSGPMELVEVRASWPGHLR
jgi:hypothetical protein